MTLPSPRPPSDHPPQPVRDRAIHEIVVEHALHPIVEHALRPFFERGLRPFFERGLRPLLEHALRPLHGLVELLLPARCPACGEATDDEEPLCERCAWTLDALDRPCPRCALRLPAPLPGAPSSPPCLGCQLHPPPWRLAHAPWAYSGELATAVRRWKLGPDATLTRPLARLIAPSVPGPDECDALVPVPLHPNRLRARQFNQASLLARAAASQAGRAPPVIEALDRVRDTPPQATLDVGSRRANLRRAFALHPGADVKGARVCLVDDVLTTGATAAACTLALLKAGAARVDVLVLARTLP